MLYILLDAILHVATLRIPHTMMVRTYILSEQQLHTIQADLLLQSQRMQR